MAERTAYRRLETAIRDSVRRLRVRVRHGGTQILAIHDTVQGQTHLKESVWLYEAARGKKTIVEIGSFRGRSTILLASGSAPDGIVTAIDPHLDFPQESEIHYGDEDRKAFEANVQRFGVASRVRKIQKLSNDARPLYDNTPIDLLWIDGDHHYAAVRDDLAKWSPLVKVGGIVACHDYTWWADVRKAWAEVIGGDAHWRVEGQCQAIIWARRLK